MTAIEILADSCARNLETFKAAIADFSDADMLVRPVASANHTAWQLGHVLCSEVSIFKGVGAAMPELPAGWAEKFTSKTAAIDDPAFFPRKDQLLEVFGKVRMATVKWLSGLSEADLAKPGPERMRAYFPTVGHLALLASGHLAMHWGQVQVIRRKLGRPIMM